MSGYVPPMQTNAPAPVPDLYRVEVGLLANNMLLREQLNRWAAEGWKLIAAMAVPIGQPHPNNPAMQVQVPGIVYMMERIVKKADPAAERLALPVLETLVSQVKTAMPFMGLTGIMRDKLEGAVQSGEAFLGGQQPA
jgi:hypothetical protein